MNNLFKKTVSWAVGVLAGVGLFNVIAYAGEPTNPAETPKFIQRLIEIGLIVPQPQRNLFAINRRLLDLTIMEAEKGKATERAVVERLQELIGKDVDIRQVDIFEAYVGTQDHM